MAFLELWRRRGDARVVDGSLLPWLLVVTTNTVRNVGRARRRHRAVLARLPEPEVSRDPADVVGGRSDAATRLAALARLTPTDQHLITLVAFDDVSLGDAAIALGLAAKTRLSRARARMEATHD